MTVVCCRIQDGQIEKFHHRMPGFAYSPWSEMFQSREEGELVMQHVHSVFLSSHNSF